MRTIYDGYKHIKNEKALLFAGANTASGFVGDYPRIADERKLERVYIIKGGPGTGKSTIMRKCADAAEKKKLSVVRYLCGSDPDSLDCVVIDDRLAILDGTAPHVKEMTYPGSASEIIDVSRYWNSDKLEESRELIFEAASKKSAYYDSAYRYLSAAELVEKDKRAISKSIFLKEKASAYIDRLMSKLGKPKSKSGAVEEARAYGLTMKGAFKIDCFNDAMKYCVTDFYGCAPLFMDLLSEKLTKAGYSITVSRLPSPDAIADVYLNDANILITASETASEEKCINLSRFADEKKCADLRGEFRLASKIQSSCIDEALLQLSKASLEHFKLEEIYIRAMDFTSLGKYTNEVSRKIMERAERK